MVIFGCAQLLLADRWCSQAQNRVAFKSYVVNTANVRSLGQNKFPAVHPPIDTTKCPVDPKKHPPDALYFLKAIGSTFRTNQEHMAFAIAPEANDLAVGLALQVNMDVAPRDTMASLAIHLSSAHHSLMFSSFLCLHHPLSYVFTKHQGLLSWTRRDCLKCAISA
jgi:hypothetical protein|mmetsp:Transcript_11863/g.21741  ORF Transcript_11863/g.21741 Transcript_11863/m.21741 type:complete len:165 (+) Transcript_11863:1484-1978(+)